MNSIPELVYRHCPHGVERKALGDICIIKTGPNITKQDIAERPGPYPVINSGRAPLGYVDHYNTENDPIGIASRGSVGLITWTPGRFFRGNLNYSCTVADTASFDPRFLYHYLLHADAELQALATHDGIPALNAGALKTLQVPAPPLAIQAKIVRILDAFTELTDELTEELAARKKQYNHYRDQLLRFERAEVEWQPLGQLAAIYGGLSGKTKTDFEDGNAWYVPYKNIFANISVDVNALSRVKISDDEKQNEVRYGDVLFTASSETADEAGMSSAVTTHIKGGIYLNSFSFGARFNADVPITPEFSKHLFRSSLMRAEIAKTASGVTRFNISKERLKKIRIPIPPIAEQARIVAMLDRFDALTTSSGEGLPREIEQRQKQYAYYRSLLLSFPKLEEGAG